MCRAEHVEAITGAPPGLGAAAKGGQDEGDEVIAKRFGGGVLLLPVDAPWQVLIEALEDFEPGFELAREQPEPQDRDWRE